MDGHPESNTVRESTFGFGEGECSFYFRTQKGPMVV